MEKIPRGFSLIELIMALVVGSILMLLAAPSLAKFYQQNQLTVMTNQLMGDIQRSRSLAVRTGQVVIFSFDNNPATQWELCPQHSAATDECIQGQLADHLKLEHQSITQGYALPPLRFSPQGQLLQITGQPAPIGFIQLSHAGIDQARCIHLLATGSTFIETDGCQW